MSLENPKVQIPTKWGTYADVQIDHNQSPHSADAWSISLMKRLSFSPKPEVILADLTSWIATSATVSYTLTGFWILGASSLVITIPLIVAGLVIGIWSFLVSQQLGDVFLKLVKIRVLLLAVGICFGVWLWVI